jgi:hypothetical protein
MSADAARFQSVASRVCSFTAIEIQVRRDIAVTRDASAPSALTLSRSAQPSTVRPRCARALRYASLFASPYND